MGKVHGLVLRTYKATKQFPREEMYGLTGQVRRASSSIPTNIAEGAGRNTDNELARFLEIAMGSASELEYLLILAKDLDYLDPPDFQNLRSDVVEIKQMLASFIKRLRG